MVRRLIQGRYNVTRAEVEQRPLDSGRRINFALKHWATLLTSSRSIRDELRH